MRKFILLLVSALVATGAVAQTVSGKSNAIYLQVEEDKPVGKLSVSWITPDLTVSALTDKELNIKLGIVSTSEIQDVSIYLNDGLVSDRGMGVVSEKESNFDQIVERKLYLQDGSNTIKVVVKNQEGVQVEAGERTFQVAVPGEVTRKDYALLFATDEYDAWSDLVNPVNDAKAIAEELEKYYGFEVKLVTNNNIDDVLLMLREYAQKSYMEDDQLFIFFAGHGQYDEVYKTGYIVGKDSKLSDPAKTSYLSHSVLRDVVDNIPCQHIFLTMDVCFGGTFDRAIASRGEDDMYKEISQAEFVKRKLKYKTRRYLTSGGKEYVPDGRPGKHSPFARKFLEALRSYGGHDKILTLGELVNYVGTINPEPRFDEFGDNAPGSDFVFVAKKQK